MKAFLKTLGLIVFLSFAGITHSWALEGSFAFQGGFVTAFGGPSPLIASSGANLFGYMDFKIFPGFYMGLSTSFSSLMSGGDRLYVDGTHVFGRIVPFSASAWTPYFMVGLGPRPFFDAQPDHRWLPGGDFQALAGAGLRHNLLPGMDLDMSVFYNLNTDTGDALSSAGVRAGLAFPFGEDESKPVASNSNAKPAAMAEAQPEAKGAYQVHKGDSLWTISKHKAGKGKKWKNIYQANAKNIKDPNLIYPHQALVLPKSTTTNEDSKD